MIPLLLFLAAPQANAAGITPTAQTTPTPPLPPANPLPLADPDEAAVMAPVNAVLAGLAAHDAAAIRAELFPGGGGGTVVSVGPDTARSVRHLSWGEFLAGMMPSNERYEGRPTDPAIDSDGLVAIVRSSYVVFFSNGKPHYCGTNQFDLVHENISWKIANITWSQRTTGCETQ